ncbi:MAG: PTS transporter subunit EIIC [Erysipelotrichaceae bacterium]|nr:PTS transporter subunit EIIC [Erysipelotrichaceae bacterium]
MPDGVPPAVANSFNSLIPAFIIVIIFSLVRYGFSLTRFESFNQFIYTILQQPLLSLGANPLAFITLIFCCSFFWFFGIHGGQIVNPILTAVYLPLATENLEALQSGVAAADLPNLITQSCWFVYSSIGGGGCTIGLCLCMFFFAKSARYKQLGRLAIPASLCGINRLDSLLY